MRIQPYFTGPQFAVVLAVSARRGHLSLICTEVRVGAMGVSSSLGCVRLRSPTLTLAWLQDPQGFSQKERFPFGLW